jgi:hypothetical protein
MAAQPADAQDAWDPIATAFSSEVDPGSRKENASKKKLDQTRIGTSRCGN